MYQFESSAIKLIIQGEETSGYYLYIFQNPLSPHSTADYHYETLEEAFYASLRKFKIPRSEFLYTHP
jgi:hypothetical protein